MRRYLLIALAQLATASGVFAHFVFIVPDDSTNKMKVIFSDTLKPDEMVTIEKIQNSKVFLIDESGKESALKWTLDKTGACYKIDVPGNAKGIIGAQTDLGVLQRGESKPFWLNYYPKTFVGAIPLADKARIGDRVPLEIVPILEGGKVRFQAIARGKPFAKAEFSVMVPGVEKVLDVVADGTGISQAFEKPGLYGVRVRLVEARSGEEKGKKYEEMRSYATLVVNFEAAQ